MDHYISYSSEEKYNLRGKLIHSNIRKEWVNRQAFASAALETHAAFN
jgi:hypothetical protein